MADPARSAWMAAPRQHRPAARLDVSVSRASSLLLTFRNEFAAVIERSGGQLAGLLDELRSRVAAEQASLAS